MATQLQLYVLYALPAIFTWLLVFFNFLPTLGVYRSTLLIGGPLLAVAALAVYAVSWVLYGVATFNDCGDARTELVAEIKEAKEDLRRRKVID